MSAADDASVGAAAPKLLVVEDEAVFARALERHLRRSGFAPRIAADLQQATRALAEYQPDLVLSDLRLPDGSALQFLGDLRERYGWDLPVVVMSAYGELEDAVEAMKLGAVEYLKKPFDLDELSLYLRKALGDADVRRSLDYSVARERQGTALPVQMLGNSATLDTVRAAIARIARLSHNAAVMPPNVLITGETGTGKDLLAQVLHADSARAQRPFVHVDCAALPDELIEAELFGHEKGAFTGAEDRRTGLIEAAEDGTLFLDEIGEVPLPLQAKLLAVLERRTLRRIGSVRERPVAAWLMAASNHDLERMSRAGKFRADLYFRLNVFNIQLPPLRERGDDVVTLARHFADQSVRNYGLKIEAQFSASATKCLRAYPWPGNIRELKHVVDRAVLLCEGEILPQHLLLPERDSAAAALPEQDAPATAPAVPAAGGTLAERERSQLLDALRNTRGNISEAARRLGISRMTMRYRMQKHGVTRDEAGAG